MKFKKNDDQGSDMAATPPGADQRSFNPSDSPLDEEKGAPSPQPENVRRVTGFKVGLPHQVNTMTGELEADMLSFVKVVSVHPEHVDEHVHLRPR